MKKIITLVLFLLLLSAVYIPAGATVYLVENGSGGNSWRTTGAGETKINLSNLSQSLNAWMTATNFASTDQIWIAAGNYNVTAAYTLLSTSPTFTPSKIYGGFIGTETDVVQRSKGTNAWDYTNETIINGSGSTTGVFTAGGDRNITIDGITYTACTTVAAITSRGGMNIQNCKFTSNTSGALTYYTITPSKNGSCTNSYFYNNSISGSSLNAACIAVNNGSSGGVYTINGCLFDTNTSSATISGASAGIKCQGVGTTNASVCVFKNNNATAGNSSAVSLTTVDNNLTNCLIYGTSLSTNKSALYMTNGNVTNCTFVNNLGGGAYLNQTSSASNLKITNTVFWGSDGNATTGSGVISAISNCLGTITNCAYNGLSANFTSTPTGTISLTTSSINLFTDPVNNIWTLKSGSTLKNTGTATGAPATDLLGNSRPQAGTYDIGTYELMAYTIVASAGTGGTMTSGAGTYDNGASATVIASANTGYRFVNWTESGTPVSTNASFTFTVSTARTLVANFEAATTISSGTTNVSTIIDNSIVTVASGAEITVGANKTLKSVTVAAGGKITITAGTLTTTDGITLESDANGTATLLNSGTLTSTVTAKQFLGSARNWYVSSPISSAPSPATNVDYYYEYMEGGTNTVELRGGQPGSPTDYWKGISNGTTMAVGKGYIAKTTAGTTVLFSGTPNNGDITTTFDLTRDDSKGKGFNLVGNPYPSYIDWVDVATANTNLENTYYYRTKNAAAGYTFVTWNGAGSNYVVSNGSLPVNTTITRYIPPTQAFWVRVKAATSTTKMYFNNGMREHRDDNGNLMKAPRQNTRTSLRLQLLNGNESDETLLYFDSEAANTYDSYDSPKMMNNSSTVPDLYSKAGDERLVINGLNTLTNNTELPLGFSMNAAATLKLKATELSNLPEGAKVYLRDKQLSTETELTPASEYSFSTTADTTNNESRFSLLFRAPGATTATANVEKERISVFVNKQNQITIIAKAGSPYAIYNAMGQLIENGTMNSGLQTTKCKLRTGIFVVKVNNQSTRVVVK